MKLQGDFLPNQENACQGEKVEIGHDYEETEMEVNQENNTNTVMSDIGEIENEDSVSDTKYENVENHVTNEFDDLFNESNCELIHPNLQCQTADAIIMILEYFLHHKLTWVTLEQLLKLFTLFSRLRKTKYFFKKILGTENQICYISFLL